MCDKQVFFVKESQCRVCKAIRNNKHYILREMMYGTNDEFEYFLCGECDSIQIVQVPDDLGKYYSENYYSFGASVESFSGRKPVYMEQSCLDVGCGSGKWLLEMAEKGYGNLYGCDPFVEAHIRYGDNVLIKKCDISQMDGQYDLIRFGDSFEHMDNPEETLEHAKRLLKANGEIAISMPIFPNAAFDTFGVNWYQLDPPRHLIVHSVKGMRYLCDKVGLKIDCIEYDSLWGQFGISYLCQLGIPMRYHAKEIVDKVFTKEDVEYFEEMTREVNQKQYGDHARFIIRHQE